MRIKYLLHFLSALIHLYILSIINCESASLANQKQMDGMPSSPTRTPAPVLDIQTRRLASTGGSQINIGLNMNLNINIQAQPTSTNQTPYHPSAPIINRSLPVRQTPDTKAMSQASKQTTVPMFFVSPSSSVLNGVREESDQSSEVGVHALPSDMFPLLLPSNYPNLQYFTAAPLEMPQMVQYVSPVLDDQYRYSVYSPLPTISSVTDMNWPISQSSPLSSSAVVEVVDPLLGASTANIGSSNSGRVSVGGGSTFGRANNFLSNLGGSSGASVLFTVPTTTSSVTGANAPFLASNSVLGSTLRNNFIFSRINNNNNNNANIGSGLSQLARLVLFPNTVMTTYPTGTRTSFNQINTPLIGSRGYFRPGMTGMTRSGFTRRTLPYGQTISRSRGGNYRFSRGGRTGGFTRSR